MTANHESRRVGTKISTAFDKILSLAIAAVRLVGAIFAVILVGHILLTLFNANPDNPLTTFFADYSSSLTLWFDGLFTPDDPKLAVVVNYGLAAVFWLVAAGIVARLLRAVR